MSKNPPRKPSTRNEIAGFGKHLATLRQQAGLSQQRLASASGTSVTAISKIEQALRYPSLELAYRLSLALGCRLDDLIPESAKKSEKS